MKIGFIPLILVLLSGQLVFAADNDNAKLLEDSRKISQEFMKKLGGTLKQQLDAGGPESAISVCKQVAPALAAEYSKNGRIVKRVSLKPRNQTLGIPDAWEKQQLQNFDHALNENKPITEMEFSEVIEGPDGRWFRYIKAIPTQQMCLQCHGQPDQIMASVKVLLARDYPKDQATGYNAGEVRGAISFQQKLD